MSIVRTRLTPEASRAAALDAARAILLEEGPQAITLKAVGARIGRTHANLLHHFGSAAGLERALIAWMAEDITRTIGRAVVAARKGEIDPRAIVDMTFDAFAGGGAAALVQKLVLSGDRDALAPILSAIRALVEELAAGDPDRPVAQMTLMLTLSALGDALLGGPLTETLVLGRDAAREMALAQVLAYARDGEWGKPG
ncbi:TetR family transcriptional regulator [Sphingomonas sp. 1P06PA]|uniref:TetR family transcriptional regulator n=1 Tax=Sphingomonas sp. 1P06PA TaxID=554121 RepID=UPI0039A70E53